MTLNEILQRDLENHKKGFLNNTHGINKGDVCKLKTIEAYPFLKDEILTAETIFNDNTIGFTSEYGFRGRLDGRVFQIIKQS